MTIIMNSKYIRHNMDLELQSVLPKLISDYEYIIDEPVTKYFFRSKVQYILIFFSYYLFNKLKILIFKISNSGVFNRN